MVVVMRVKVIAAEHVSKTCRRNGRCVPITDAAVTNSSSRRRHIVIILHKTHAQIIIL